MSITRLAVGSLKAHAATANRYPRQTCSHYPDSPLSGRRLPPQPPQKGAQYL